MKFKYLFLFSLLFIVSLSISACGGSADPPAQTVEGYYHALVKKDQNRLVNLSCADWEPTALLEFDSFANVETTLENFSCETVQETESLARVSCEGYISASYGGEMREFSLNKQTYLVVYEGSEWRVCGYE